MTHKDQSQNPKADTKHQSVTASAQHERADKRGSGSASEDTVRAQTSGSRGSHEVSLPKNSEVELIKNELIQMTEMAKRTMADLHNLKRRQEDERRLIITMANVNLIRALLPVLDNLERAIIHTPETIKNDQNTQWLQGIEICAKQLRKALTDAGLKPMETVGQPFNPDFHEALAQSPGSKDTIIEELEKGYLLGERVIRHAKVRVGNGQPRSGGA